MATVLAQTLAQFVNPPARPTADVAIDAPDFASGYVLRDPVNPAFWVLNGGGVTGN